MKVLPLDPRLELQDGRIDLQRVHEWMRDVARVTRELQTPPVARIELGTNQALTGGATADVVKFDTSKLDTHSGWDGTNWRYRFQRSGNYHIYAQLALATTLATDAAGYVTCNIRKGGTNVSGGYVYHVTLGKQDVLTVEWKGFAYGTDYTSPEYADVIIASTPTGHLLDSSANRTYVDVEFLGIAPLR